MSAVVQQMVGFIDMLTWMSIETDPEKCAVRAELI